MNQSFPYTSSYRSEIDGLRAFAVLSVVAFHAFPSWLKGGFIGVDIFFVISGFLITSHIFEKLDKGQFSFTDFFGRRIRRIFPALILVMVCPLAFGWFGLLADEFAQLGKHVASGAAFITNFILVDESGYFDNAAETKPMLHLWSLAVEEQFYIVWPLVLWLAWKRKFNLLTITILVAVVSFYLNLRFVKSHPTETFFWPVGRFWELLSGSVLAWLLLYKSDLLSRFKLWVDKFLVRIIHSKEVEADGTTTSNLLSFFGLFLVAYGVIYINESLSFPSKWALIPVLGAVLIIASGSKAWLNRIFLGYYVNNTDWPKTNVYEDLVIPRKAFEHGFGSSLKWYEGKDSWLFLGNHYAQTVAKRRLAFEPSSQNISNEVARFEALAKKGIEFDSKVALLIGSNKSSVYTEYLPNEMNPSDRRYSTFVTDELKGVQNLIVADPTDLLVDAKSKEWILYWRTDTHWNQKGSYLAFKYLMEELSLRVPSVEFRNSAKTHGGDLINISKLGDFPLSVGDD